MQYRGNLAGLNGCRGALGSCGKYRKNLYKFMLDIPINAIYNHAIQNNINNN